MIVSPDRREKMGKYLIWASLGKEVQKRKKLLTASFGVNDPFMGGEGGTLFLVGIGRF